MSENLESKYGRRKNSDTANADSNANSSDDNNDGADKNENASKYARNKPSEPQKKIVQEELKQKEIKDNIAEVLSQYSSEHSDVLKPAGIKQRNIRQESSFVKILKTLISFLIILVVASIILAFFMRAKINVEGEQIIEQIKKAETLYYTVAKKYHYFSKTDYDNTLGIDLSNYNFFTAYEVVPSEESGNYEVKLYGATNAFTIAYYTVKSYLK